MNLKELENELKLLLKEEDNADRSLIKDLLSKYNSNDWKNYVSFDCEDYKRNYVYKSDLFDIIIICWGISQSTKLHGHPEKGCFFKLLEGELKEELYKPNTTEPEINIIKKDAITFEHDSIGKHKVINNLNTNSVGLYIYQSAGSYNPNK